MSNMQQYFILTKGLHRKQREFAQKLVEDIQITGGGSIAKLNDTAVATMRFNTNEKDELESIQVGTDIYEVKDTKPYFLVNSDKIENIPLQLNTEVDEEGVVKIKSITVKDKTYELSGSSTSTIKVNTGDEDTPVESLNFKIDDDGNLSSVNINDKEIPIKSSGEESIITTEIPLMKDFGSIPAGTVLTGKSIVDIFMEGFIPPTAPEITSFTINPATAVYEIGTSVSVTPTASVKKMTNPIKEVKFSLNNTDIASVYKGSNNYSTENPIALDKSKNQTIKVTASDSQLPVTSKSITVKFVRAAFYGTAITSQPLTESSQIRALATAGSGKTLDPKSGTELTINIKAGAAMVVFAIPSTLSIKSIKYVEGFNADVISNFAVSTVSVEGAAGYDAIDYKVYTYIPVTPFGSNVTYKATIN